MSVTSKVKNRSNVRKHHRRKDVPSIVRAHPVRITGVILTLASVPVPDMSALSDISPRAPGQCLAVMTATVHPVLAHAVYCRMFV